jgi:hypothetical protein
VTWDPLEREIEAAVRDLFITAGWKPVKTDAAMVIRGGRGARRGHIDEGFPDSIYVLGLPGLTLSLAAVVELKTATGTLRDKQIEMHQHLQLVYQITTVIIRDPQEALHLIAEGRRLRSLIRRA